MHRSLGDAGSIRSALREIVSVAIDFSQQGLAAGRWE
jgi:hypothetical protein